MIKSFAGFVAMFVFLCSVAFAAYASPKGEPTALPTVSAVLPDVTPIDFSAVGSLTPKAAPKAAKVAPRAKVWTCGDWEASNVGGAYKRCEWR